MLDIDRPGYPLPCDPVTGVGWWRWNVFFIMRLAGYGDWQSSRRMSEIIPVLRWLLHGSYREDSDAG